MARSNSFFGIRRGQAMGMVFSHGQDGWGNAQQITRALPESVANPRTASQQYSRMIASSVAKSYAVLKPLADHSTEGVSYGQQCMNAFLRRNNAIARQNEISTRGYAVYSQEDGVVFEGCQLAKGTLPKSENWATTDVNEFECATLPKVVQMLGESEKDVCAALGFENVGDVNTFVALLGSPSEQEYMLNGYQVYGTPILAYVRLKLKKAPTSSSVTTKANFDALFDYSDSDGIQLTITTGENDRIAAIKIAVETALAENGYDCQFFCEVMSHTTAEGWKRSNAFFALHANENIAYPEKDQALDSYPVGTQKILNGAGM